MFRKKVEFLENTFRNKLLEINKKMQIEDRINKKLEYLHKINYSHKENISIICDDKIFLTSKDIILNCKLYNEIQQSYKLNNFNNLPPQIYANTSFNTSCAKNVLY